MRLGGRGERKNGCEGRWESAADEQLKTEQARGVGGWARELGPEGQDGKRMEDGVEGCCKRGGEGG